MLLVVTKKLVDCKLNLHVCKGNKITVKCDSWNRLLIKDAVYGRSKHGIDCTDGEKNITTYCATRSRLDAFELICNGKQYCQLSVTDDFFGSPCEVKGGEYLVLEYLCVNQKKMKNNTVISNNNTTTLSKPIAIIPLQQLAFIRSDLKSAGRQYLTTIQLNHSAPVLLPLTFSLGGIKKLPSISIADKELQKNALEDLATKKVVQLRLGDGDCTQATSGENHLKQLFCIYSHAGYVYTTTKGIEVSKNSVNRYQVDINAKDKSSNSTHSNGSLIINTVQQCYPVSYYYANVQQFCPRDKRYFSKLSPEMIWPATKYKVYVNNDVVLGDIHIDTNYTSLITPGHYTVFVQTSQGNYSQVFEYFDDIQFVGGKRDRFYPRVYGDKFSIILSNAIFINQSEFISFSIISDAHGTFTRFYGIRALSLFASKRLDKCPSKKCFHYYRHWRQSFEYLTMSGHIECLDNDGLYFTYLSHCRAELFIHEDKEFHFRQPFSLTCEGVSYKQKNLIVWYKDDKRLDRVKGETLIKSGLDFTHQGYYYCEVVDFEGKTLRSNKVLVKFIDVVKTLIYVDIQRQQYNNMKVKNGAFNTDVMLKSKVTQLISHVSISFVSVTMPKFEESFNGWMIIKCIANSYLKPNKSRVQLYESIKEKNVAILFQPVITRSNSLALFDRDVCLPDFTGEFSSYGKYKWNYASSDSIATQSCNFGDGNITRNCVSEFTKFATWMDTNTSSCEYSSESSETLNRLSRNLTRSMTNEELTDLTITTKEITSNQSSTFTTDDTKLITDIVVTIVDDKKEIPITVTKNIIDITNSLFEVDDKVLVWSQTNDLSLKRLTKSIEVLASKLKPLNTSTTGNALQVASSNIGIASISSDGKEFQGGVLSVKTKNKEFVENPFSYTTVKSKTSLDNDITATVVLPPKIFQNSNVSSKTHTISIAYYTDAKFFPVFQRSVTGSKIDKIRRIQTGVLSVHVSVKDQINLTEDLIYEMKLSGKYKDNQHFYCVFWDFNANDGLGNWSTAGCKTIKTDTIGRIKCSCSHLTNFAILFDPNLTSNEKLDEKHMLALSIITYVGCSLSLTGIILTMITLLLFRFLRRNTPSKVLLGLCFSLGILMLVFLLLVERTKPRWLCITTAALLQYFILCTFGWMLVEAVTLYLKVVMVTGEFTSHFMRKVISATLGLPAIIVAICMALQLEAYGNEDYCIVGKETLLYGLFVPTCLIIFVNIIVFVMVVISIHKNSKTTKSFSHSSTTTPQLRIAVSCCALLGLTWIFGALAISDTRLVFQYLFCIFNSLQGAFIFYFNVLRQHRIQEAWKRYLSGHGRTFEPSSSSTISSRLRARTMTNRSDGNPTLMLSDKKSPEIGECNRSFRDEQSPPLGLSARLNPDVARYNEASNSDTKSELSFTSYIEKDPLH